MYFTRRHLSSWKGSPAPLLPRALHAAPRKRGVGGTRAIAHSIYIYITYICHILILDHLNLDASDPPFFKESPSCSAPSLEASKI